MDHHLLARGVSRSVDERPLLLPVDLDVPAGTCAVVRGPNGAGKTTLLRLLAGMDAPSSGTVLLGGRPADERDPAFRRVVASMLGPIATYRDLTVHDHLTLIDATWGGDPADDDERIASTLERFRLGRFADRYPHTLSSGQSQLFFLACTFFRPARVLVLDEPEQRLDEGRRRVVGEAIRARCAAGGSAVVACHDDSLTEAIADTVLHLEPADRD